MRKCLQCQLYVSARLYGCCAASIWAQSCVTPNPSTCPCSSHKLPSHTWRHRCRVALFFRNLHTVDPLYGRKSVSRPFAHHGIVLDRWGSFFLIHHGGQHSWEKTASWKNRDTAEEEGCESSHMLLKTIQMPNTVWRLWCYWGDWEHCTQGLVYITFFSHISQYIQTVYSENWINSVFLLSLNIQFVIQKETIVLAPCIFPLKKGNRRNSVSHILRSCKHVSLSTALHVPQVESNCWCLRLLSALCVLYSMGMLQVINLICVISSLH